MSRSRLKCVGKRMSNKPGPMKSIEHTTANPRTRACTTAAFTPGFPSGRELKSERSSQCRGKWVRSLRRRLIIRVGTYSGVERFGAKERWLYIEHTEGDLRMGGRGGGCPRRRRRLRNEAASEVEERGDEWVRDARVVYPIVAFGIDSDEGLVWF